MEQDAAAPPPISQQKQRQFPCKQCGANLAFAPGTDSLKCPYCGTVNEIPRSLATVAEHDFVAQLAEMERQADTVEQITVHCNNCGAETTLKPNVTADRCPFCGGGIVAQGKSTRQIKPQALLPFHVTQQQAAQAFREWIGSLWFAPSELARRAEAAQIAGVYIPAWTYDTDTRSDYTGQRGDDYWDTETYTSFENGQHVTRTRQVRKTRWWPASGTVANNFDDVLVLASRSLPQSCAEALEPWDLPNLTPYQDEFLSGFVGESYQIGLPEGFEVAKGFMQPQIEESVRQDIGGDHQTISSLDTRYFDITFKHVLLPVWLAAYQYRDKTYRFVVNGRTGQVQGERPWSWIKIAGVVVAVIVAGVAIYFAVHGTGSGGPALPK